MMENLILLLELFINQYFSENHWKKQI